MVLAMHPSLINVMAFANTDIPITELFNQKNRKMLRAKYGEPQKNSCI